MRCVVFGCENYKKKISDRNPELNFYLFPKKDPHLCKKWVEFCRRPKPFYLKSARICGDHFRARDKERNFRYEMGFEKAYCPKLRHGAVPCIYKEPGKNDDLKIDENLGSFPAVMLEEDSEHSQQSLSDAEEDKDHDKDPLTPEKEKRNSNIQIAIVNNRLNEETEGHQTAFKGIFAVLYPVDGAGKPLQSSIEQNLVDQAVNVNPLQASTLPSKELLQQIIELKKENNILKKSEVMYKKTLKDLEKKVNKSNYERESLEKKLKTIFTSNQIRQMKTGKRVIWSPEDLTKAVRLYKSSPATYRLLRNQNYPFPSQKSVQVFMSRAEIKESERVNEQQIIEATFNDCSFADVDENSAITENSTSDICTDYEEISEFLTLHPSTINDEPKEYSVSFEQNAQSENYKTFTAIEDHSYSLVVD